MIKQTKTAFERHVLSMRLSTQQGLLGILMYYKQITPSQQNHSTAHIKYGETQRFI